MKKKIAGLVVTGALALTALVGAATFAYFNDVTTSSNNSIQAGELKLTAFRDDMLISGPMFYSTPDATNRGTKPTGLWKPGKFVSRGLVIKNEGSVDSVLQEIYAVSDDGFVLNGPTEADQAFTAFANQTNVSVYALTSDFNNSDWRDTSDVAAALEQADIAVQTLINNGGTEAEVNALMNQKMAEVAAIKGTEWRSTYLGTDSLSTMIAQNRIWERPDVSLKGDGSVYFIYQVRFLNPNIDQNINQGKNYKFTFAQEFRQAGAQD